MLKNLIDQFPKFITLKSKKELVTDLKSLNISFETIFDVGGT